jgi:acetyltransferase-like isoleucine patch superfamily enzyme
MGRAWRVGWTILSIFVVESVIFGLAVLPAFLCWSLIRRWPFPPPQETLIEPVIIAMSLIPAYLVFAVALCALSALAMRLLGWRTQPGAAWRLADLEWPLLDWARYMVSTHVVRVLVGICFRGSPLWTWYLRINGARIGRGVYVNSTSISDHNLLDFGDGVVIGESVHLSGHTVEGGYVKTGCVRLGNGVTVGLGSIVGIGTSVGDRAQIGALSVVPKHTSLEGGGVYVGVPVRRIEKGSRETDSVEV